MAGRPKIKTPFEYIMENSSSVDEQTTKSLNMLASAHAEEWYLGGADFWYWARFIETDDEDQGIIHRFPIHYDYLHRIKHEIDTNQKVVLLKARRLLLSWLGMMDMLHCALYCGSGLPDTYDAFRGGVMSIGETEAQYLIERATKVYHRLPHWMKEKNRLVTDNKLLMRFEKGGTIQAFAMKREGPQTFGFSKVFFDEMALQEAARTTWTGMIPTLGDKGKLLAVSTPNGRMNFFHDVWNNQRNQFKDMRRISVWWDGEVRVHENDAITERFAPKNPPHDKKWLTKATAGMDQQMIARMFELSFTAYAGLPVWTEFNHVTHVRSKIEINSKMPMLIGWDFGFHFPAVVFFQYGSKDQFVGIAEYIDYDIGFDKFAQNVKEFASSLYNRDKTPEIHFVDPAGFQRYHSKSVSGAMSDVAEIKRQFGRYTRVYRGAVDVGDRTNEGDRLKQVRRLWALRADGEPGILISDKMDDFIEGCQGAYHYPEKGGEQPEKDIASHVQDAVQYLVTGYNRMMGNKTTKAEPKKYDWVGGRTGM